MIVKAREGIVLGPGLGKRELDDFYIRGVPDVSTFSGLSDQMHWSRNIVIALVQVWNCSRLSDEMTGLESLKTQRQELAST